MRLVAFIMAFVLSAGSLIARTSVDDLRRFVLAGDYEQVEAAFLGAHHSAETVQGDYTEQRLLFAGLAVSDPCILAFTDERLTRYPNSPYAHATRAWQLYIAGWWARGHESAGRTYPAAMDMMRHLHRRGRDEAWVAYEMAPDLVGASDAVIRLGTTVRGKRSVNDILAEVMAITPNSGTILRAQMAFSPQWGGSVAKMRKACATYAWLVRDIPDYDANYCLLEAVYRVGLPAQLMGEFDDMLDADDRPGLDFARRLKAMRTNDFSPDARALFAAYLADPDVTNLEAARFHDSRSRVIGQPLVEPEVFARRLREVQAEIAFDPNNPDLLEVLKTSWVGETCVPDPPAFPDMIAYTRRALTVAPYDADLWLDYAQNVSMAARSGKFSAGDVLFGNAIAYSNYRPDIIARAARAKYDFLAELDRQAKGGFVSRKIATDTPDADAELACPLTRMLRLYLAQCDVQDWSQGCILSEDDVQDYVDLVDAGVRPQSCAIERNARLEELLYIPVPLDEIASASD